MNSNNLKLNWLKLIILPLSIWFASYAVADEVYVDGQTNEGHIIQSAGTNIAQQPILNFATGLTVTNIGSKTTITTSATGSGDVTQDQSSSQTIGSTTQRLTKLWATDISVTNAIDGSITGNAGTVTNGVYLSTGFLLDQTSPQTVINGTPVFSVGLNSSATMTTTVLSVDSPTLVANLSGYTDKVGIGTATPDGTLHVQGAGTAGAVTAPAFSDGIVIEDNVNTGLSILTPDNREQFITFGDVSDNDVGWISYLHDTTPPVMQFRAGAVAMTILETNRNVGIGTTAPDQKLEINTGAATGGMRISYNDADGSAATYSDYTVDSGGDVSFTATGGDISFGNENLSTTGSFSASPTTITGTLSIRETGESPTYYTVFQGGNQGGTVTYTLPTAVAGGAGYVLTDAAGDGVLSWSAAGAGDVTLTGTQTLTNKRINPRIFSTDTTAAPIIDLDSTDQYNITALAATITSITGIGTPVDGQKLIMRIKDNGTAFPITFGDSVTSIVATPTTTTAGKWMYWGFIYNATSGKLDLVAEKTQT